MSLVGDELGGHETVVLSARLVGRMLMTLKARSTWIDHKDYQPFVSGWQNSWSWWDWHGLLRIRQPKPLNMSICVGIFRRLFQKLDLDSPSCRYYPISDD